MSSLDPRIDLLVAALYGELSAEESARFEKLLAEDEEIRREWRELQGTRQALAGWQIEESPPSFVLVEARPTAPIAQAPRRSWFGPVRALWEAPARIGWAVAAAAILLLVLSALDFRVEVGDGVLAFRLGESAPQLAERAASGRASSDQVLAEGAGSGQDGSQGGGRSGVAANRNGGESGSVDLADDETRIPLTGDFARVHDESPYLTRDEFHAYSEGVARAFGDLIRAADYNRVKSEEFNGYVRTLYQGLEDRQAESYYDLRARIETIRFGLDQRSAEAFLEDYPGGSPISPGARSGGQPGSANEDDSRGEGGR